jgi:hypothetical protein
MSGCTKGSRKAPFFVAKNAQCRDQEACTTSQAGGEVEYADNQNPIKSVMDRKFHKVFVYNRNKKESFSLSIYTSLLVTVCHKHGWEKESRKSGRMQLLLSDAKKRKAGSCLLLLLLSLCICNAAVASVDCKIIYFTNTSPYLLQIYLFR